MIEAMQAPQAPRTPMPTRQQIQASPAPWLIAITLLSAVQTTASSPGWAQMSPVCERNGKREYCALTPIPAATTTSQVVDLIMFADDRVYRVERDLQSCRKISPNVETCNARITAPPAGSRSIPALYRATYFEGGVKHDYSGRGIRIGYRVAD